MRGEKGEPLGVGSLAAETREGFRGGSGLAARLVRYGTAKANALQFARYLQEVGERALAADLRACGNYLLFHDYYAVGEVRLAAIRTCRKHLICPLCAIRRGARALRVYLARVDALLRCNPRLRPYLVTLTVRNGPDLRERFRHLASCLRAYHKRRKGTRQHGEVLKASAAVWSYEFTNRGQGWHPHVHAVWLCEEAPEAWALSREWHALTGDSFVVDVRPIMPDGDGILLSGFCEVFKYAVKFADLEPRHRLEAYRVLSGKRLQGSFGDLRGLDVSDQDSDDLLEDLPYIERLFVYVSRGYLEVLRHEAASACESRTNGRLADLLERLDDAEWQALKAALEGL